MISSVTIWLCIGLAFLIIELLTYSFFFLFFSIGSFLTTILTFFYNFDFGIQISIFSLTSIVFLLLFKNSFKRAFASSIQRDEEEYEGKTVLCLNDFISEENFFGKVEFNGSQWKAKSLCYLEKNEIAKIINRDNLILIIDKIKKEVKDERNS